MPGLSELTATNATRKDNPSRAYKACLSCRKRKTRCDLGGRDQPPCQRCRHELRECIIPEERTSKRHGQQETQSRRLPSAASQGRRGGRSPSPRTSPPQAQTVRHHKTAEVDACLTPADVGACGANMEGTIVQTAVGSGNEALGLLLRETGLEEPRAGDGPVNINGARSPSGAAFGLRRPQQPSGVHGRSAASPVPLALANDDVKLAWKSSKLGGMGWLQADEAVLLLDFFYREMAPLTPIISIQDHPELSSYAHVISEEPLLCSVILMLSSRYNAISDLSRQSHAFHVHSCLWRYCQRLVTCLIFGQNRAACGGSRSSYGMIMALLLLCEWHPRMMHFPPDADGLGGLAMAAFHSDSEQQGQTEHERWKSHIHDAVQCSDRMSTTLVGCALTLSHELHVFDDANEGREYMATLDISPQKAYVRHLVYLYTYLLADKPSFASLLPQKVSRFMAENRQIGAPELENGLLARAWLELSESWTSFRKLAAEARKIVPDDARTRRCLSLVDHYTSLLFQWHQRHMRSSDGRCELQKILIIEYEYAQVHCNSFGMQVQIEHAGWHKRTSGSACMLGSGSEACQAMTSADYAHFVTMHCCALLETAVGMSDARTLRYAPVRVFMRTTATSVFLLKSLAVGVRTGRLDSTFDLLERVVRALEASVVDDVHLARHYATLLKSSLQKAKRSFATTSTRQCDSSWAAPMQATDVLESESQALASESVERNTASDSVVHSAFDYSGEQWLALPFGSENDIFSNMFPEENDFRHIDYMSTGLPTLA